MKFVMILVIYFVLLNAADAFSSQKINILSAETIDTKLKTSNPYHDICLTPGCVHAASKILKKIDEEVEPCDDFYKFR